MFISMSSYSLMNNLLNFFFLMDSLSARLLWLTRGVILAILSRNIIKIRTTLWWWLALALVLGFRRRRLFFFYIFFEMSLIPILLMILSRGRQPERLSAGAYLLFYTTAISVPYLAVVVSMELKGIIRMKSSSLVFRGMAFFLLAPFFVKMPMFGFHFWLPKAHVEARTGGSIVLAGMLLKLGRYGAARIVNLFVWGFRSSWVSSGWIILAFASSLVTFIQRDLKKMVAYRSVTHITFIIVGLISGTKLILVSVVLVSLAHGWAAIGLFARAGTLRHSSSSRLGTLLGSETTLFWVIIVVGLILISNAGVPPIPSFFPEIFILLRSMRTRGYSLMVFIFLRLTVCYYNAYLFLWVSHVKARMTLRIKVSFTERLILFTLFLVRLESLLWLQVF